MKGNKARLVLADDNPDVLREMKQLLLSEFDLVATADNGAALLDAAQTYRPEVVVTDVSMPELSGIDATRRLLELGYCRAVVVFSASDSPDIAKAAFAAGAKAYVVKENSEDLISGIRAAIRGELFLSSQLQQ